MESKDQKIYEEIIRSIQNDKVAGMNGIDPLKVRENVNRELRKSETTKRFKLISFLPQMGVSLGILLVFAWLVLFPTSDKRQIKSLSRAFAKVAIEQINDNPSSSKGSLTKIPEALELEWSLKMGIYRVNSPKYDLDQLTQIFKKGLEAPSKKQELPTQEVDIKLLEQKLKGLIPKKNPRINKNMQHGGNKC